ncbi:MAG TPA: HEAT repeat domain-containing protein [Kofleriaceae bacterium]|nr:HEAT repeat domain-containing protein [Kofleriaceae bacterium]
MKPARLIQLVVVVLALVATRAHAGQVETLIDQLNNDGTDKVRLAAAVNLAKLGDAKAILPLAKALLNDSDKNVRGACAVALGVLVTSSTKSSIKGLVVNNLKSATENDTSDFVKQQASKALASITGQAGTTTTGTTGTTTGGGAGGIYVNIGPMSSKAGSANDAKLRVLMVKVAGQTLGKVASKMTTSWPGGLPTKTVLAQKSVSGFYVDGTLNTLTSKVSGGSATVTCKVSMLLADFPDKNMFGFLNGGASVQGSSSERDQAMAGEDCVSAVIEDLIAKKIVPTICSKTSASCP